MDLQNGGCKPINLRKRTMDPSRPETPKWCRIAEGSKKRWLDRHSYRMQTLRPHKTKRKKSMSISMLPFSSSIRSVVNAFVWLFCFVNGVGEDKAACRHQPAAKRNAFEWPSASDLSYPFQCVIYLHGLLLSQLVRKFLNPNSLTCAQPARGGQRMQPNRRHGRAVDVPNQPAGS